jgi:hypothetical protein
MGISLRVMLIAIVMGILMMVMRGIKKNTLESSDSVYWLTLALFLLVCAIFPGIVTWTSGILGFISPSNMVFLFGIVALLIRVFQQDQKICSLRQKVTTLVQNEALDAFEEDSANDENNENAGHSVTEEIDD